MNIVSSVTLINRFTVKKYWSKQSNDHHLPFFLGGNTVKYYSYICQSLKAVAVCICMVFKFTQIAKTGTNITCHSQKSVVFFSSVSLLPGLPEYQGNNWTLLSVARTFKLFKEISILWKYFLFVTGSRRKDDWIRSTLRIYHQS